jgi:Family of unknown function (DUF5996)
MIPTRRMWRALVRADRVFKLFRSGFLGKVSPVHFFWGSFDLAVTRFSGRRAPLHPGGVPGLPDSVTREAYSHEVSSAGFWPGNDAFPQAAFYSYAYPEPGGFRDRPITAGYFEAKLGEFILPYDTLREAAPLQPRLVTGIAGRWNAKWAFRRKCVHSKPYGGPEASSYGNMRWRTAAAGGHIRQVFAPRVRPPSLQ